MIGGNSMDKIQQQIDLEFSAIEEGILEYRKTLRTDGETNLTPARILISKAMTTVIEGLVEFKHGTRGSINASTVQCLNSLDISDEQIAFIALRFVFANITYDGSIQYICVSLAKQLIAQHELNKFRKELPGYVFKVYEEQKRQPAHRKVRIMSDLKRKKGIEDDVFSHKELFLLGKKLVDIIIERTGYFRYEVQKKFLRIRPEQKMIDWLDENHAKCELLSPELYPMIVSPIPWEDINVGGYYTIKQKGMKVSAQKNQGKIPQRIWDIINHIQSTPWAINTKVLEIAKEVWENNLPLGSLPSREPEETPDRPWTSDAEFEFLKENEPKVIQEWKWSATKIHDRNFRMVSKRVTVSIKLNIAEKFKNEPEIYFPHSMDWRGRIYPIPTLLNPQSDDIAKSLLKFSKGKVIGKEGFKWLKVHGANCAGKDKISFEERVKWIESNHDLILDSASNPLDGFKFWSDADEPWQFLAFCFEYAGVIEQGVDNFVSHIPVSVDGTCSGLQHFSAMLLDEVGGSSVNLVPMNEPQDVYKQVANVVSKLVEEDALNGEENALIWHGKIDRKIAKRNVMTLPYGAKKFGFANQIREELAKRGSEYLGIDDDFEAATYLADKMWDGIGQVVIAARQAMDWLQQCARIMNRTGNDLQWTTPVGLKVIQQYRKHNTVRIQTYWGGMRHTSNLIEHNNRLNTTKQTNGISPNFVHSMDACHLMLTVEECIENGISDFAFIHDSFGTHAANVDKLNDILREIFVNQYSTCVLEKFREEILSQLPENLHDEVPPVPDKGNLNLNEVKNSKYFFA